MEILGPKDVDFDTDELTEEERLFMCEKAMKTVLGENFKFTEDSTGQSHYYRFYKNQSNGYLVSRGKFQADEVVKAFSCPTEPVAYLHLASTIAQNVAQVIVSGKDLALSLMQFK